MWQKRLLKFLRPLTLALMIISLIAAYKTNKPDDSLSSKFAGTLTRTLAIDLRSFDLWRNDALQAGTGSTERFAAPIEGTVVSRFGAITVTPSGKPASNLGIDIKPGIDRTVKASAAGKVTETGTDGAYGLYIMIEHPNGYETIYANCASISITEGYVAEQGETIGTASDFLHFEVWHGLRVRDPEDYVKYEN